jgi:hypothetical protein
VLAALIALALIALGGFSRSSSTRPAAPQIEGGIS